MKKSIQLIRREKEILSKPRRKSLVPSVEMNSPKNKMKKCSLQKFLQFLKTNAKKHTTLLWIGFSLYFGSLSFKTLSFPSRSKC